MATAGLSIRGWSRRAVVIASVMVIVFVLILPVPMTGLAYLPLNWPKAAQVGEAYGGASAVISGLAFFGIAVSLLLQWRQLRSSLLFAIKQRHFELVRLTLDNPRYLFVDGQQVTQDPDATLKVFGNLVVNHWALAWDLGFMSESALRDSAKRLFEAAIARDWWLAWGKSYLLAEGREEFFRIMSQECEVAQSDALLRHSQLTSNVASLATATRTRSTVAKIRSDNLAAAGIGMLIGVSVTATLLRKKRRPARRNVFRRS